AQEVREGRGSPHGGAFLDIASKRRPEEIRKKLPSMWQQFHELADVDITRDPMEVFPTTHYVMGGVRVDPESQAATVPGLYAAGEVGGGLHGANRLGGNSLSDLLVFGRRAGTYAAQYARAFQGEPRESRGAHTRVEYPDSDKHFGTVSVIVRRQGDRMTVAQEPIPPLPDELRRVVEGEA